MTPIVNVIISKSTFVGSDFKESLDLALVCAAFDHQVNLIFVDDGIYNLLGDQHSQVLGEKNQTNLLKGLNFYDIDNIYVDQCSMESRNISPENLLIDVTSLRPNALNDLNQQAKHVVEL